MRSAPLAGLLLLAACTTTPTPPPRSTPLQPSPVALVCHYNTKPDGRVTPDAHCTPGAIDPRVTQANLQSTICKAGYSTSVRPPSEVTSALKREQMAEYGVGGDNPAGYEEDHLVSLELGGAPNDPKNLWPEPGASPNEKDSIENRLHDQVCKGQTSLAAAQGILAADWTMAR